MSLNYRLNPKVITLQKALNALRLEVPSAVADDVATIVWDAMNATHADTAKAFGGCTKCYGKGYATVADRWLASDTDQDIGTPGGTTAGGKDFAIKYCSCSRGNQLKELVGMGAF